MSSYLVFPDRRLVVNHSLGNGYYYTFLSIHGNNPIPVGDHDLEVINEQMQLIVKENLPIHHHSIAWKDAVSHFESTGQEQTQFLVEQHNQDHVSVVVCDNYIDLWHGPHLSRTGLLSNFELLRYPIASTLTALLINPNIQRRPQQSSLSRPSSPVPSNSGSTKSTKSPNFASTATAHPVSPPPPDLITPSPPTSSSSSSYSSSTASSSPDLGLVSVHGARSSSVLNPFYVLTHDDIGSGFLLRYPHTADPKTMPPFVDNPKIFQTYFENIKGGTKLGVRCVGDLNKLINKKDSRDLVQYIAMAETLQDRKLAEVATKIIEKEDAHLVLIAGPSSSAKTTFAMKLCVQLRVLGKAPLCVSLDDFYVDRVKTPKDAAGEYDYECLEALNIKCINETFQGLLDGKKVRMPHYNFVAGLSEPGEELQLESNGIIVVEGIHGLNDGLTGLIAPERKFRIFISALTQINIDDHNRIPTTDNRLLRRIVRDYQYRGYSAEDTIVRWPSVRSGEEKYIFPFQNKADFVYNSALDYEISTLKTIAEPLLMRIKPDNSKAYNEAVRLLNTLRNFLPLAEKYVPTLSLLREFIGGSPFHDKV